MFRKVLVAHDGSPGGKLSLELGVDIAARYGAELHSISVQEDLPAYAARIGEVEFIKEQADSYYSQVTDAAKAMAAAQGVELVTHVLPGHEVETIVNFCREGNFDLLVIGFMGHSRIFERIWGSTSQTLTRLSPCSVLVAK